MVLKRLPLHKTLSQGKKGFRSKTLQVMPRYYYAVNSCKTKKASTATCRLSAGFQTISISISKQKKLRISLIKA